MSNDQQKSVARNLVEGIDYYLEDGIWIFTRAYHLKRGSCCGNGCRHCPFETGAGGCVGAEESAISPVGCVISPAGSVAGGVGGTLFAKAEKCPRCQRHFACHAGRCWCDGLVVPLEALVELRQTYESCVCPECLQHFADKHRGEMPGQSPEEPTPQNAMESSDALWNQERIGS